MIYGDYGDCPYQRNDSCGFKLPMFVFFGVMQSKSRSIVTLLSDPGSLWPKPNQIFTIKVD